MLRSTGSITITAVSGERDRTRPTQRRVRGHGPVPRNSSGASANGANFVKPAKRRRRCPAPAPS